MKKYTCAVVCWMVAMYAGAAVIVSNPGSVPTENVEISQLVQGGIDLQARNLNATLWNGVAQSLLWTTDDALDGIGVYMSGNQTTWTTDQEYVFVMQQLDGYRGTGTAVVAQVEFTLEAGKVAQDTWLHLDLDNLALVNGQRYGFMIAPTLADMQGGKRLYLETTASGVNTLYGGGDANQFDLDSTYRNGVPPENDYGSAGEDLTFYMQTIPEPATLGLLLLSACGVLGVRRLTM